jgi:creatinine amidohydrolase
MNSVWIQELTWQDVDEYLKHDDTVILPIGSTEQHGPAGPLGVDTYAAIALAEDAAKRAGVLVTPPLWFGDSPHHLGFPGTISLKPTTLMLVVKDIVHTLYQNGMRRFILLNGHKGTNLSALTLAARDLLEYELKDIRISLTDPLFLCTNAGEVKGNVAEHHAGVLEISHVMYKFPGLVREDRQPDKAVDLQAKFGNYIKPDLFGKSGGVFADVFWSSREQREFAPTGSFSDSSNASAEMGKAYHDNMVDNFVEFIEWFKKY